MNTQPTNNQANEDTEAEDLERKADELLASLKQDQEAFSKSSGELVSKLNHETDLLTEESEKLSEEIGAIEEDGRSKLQAAAEKFISEDDK